MSLGKIESGIGHARKNVNNVDRNKPLPFKGLNIRILSIIPLKGRGTIKQGSTQVVYRDPSRTFGFSRPGTTNLNPSKWSCCSCLSPQGR